jgi:hypothetical protein
VSDGEALGRHLEPFGEIRITRLEPETTVAWEGDRASGTVQLEPAGWGTKVTLTAELGGDGETPEPARLPVRIVPEPQPEPDPEPEPEPLPAADAVTPGPAGKLGFFARLFRRRAAPRPEPEPEPDESEPVAGEMPEPESIEPESAPEPHPDPEPEPAGPTLETDGAALDPDRALAILTGVLDDLGSARHRPFSR